MRVFVAGASGALGRPLMRRLVASGYETYGLANKPESAEYIESLGGKPVIGNALDRESVFDALSRSRPHYVIDQLTSLPSDPSEMPDRLPFDRKLRLEGGGNLFAATQAHGVRRYIQQSSGFYLNGEGQLATEHSDLRTQAPGHIGQSSRMYAELERRVLTSASLETVALRYGFFYGPGTWYWNEGPFSDRVRDGQCPIFGKGHGTFSFIHVEDAADATIAALSAPAGVYNIVDDQPVKAAAFLSAFARWLEGPPPQSIDASQTIEKYGAEALYYHNELSGSSNLKAKELLSLKTRVNPWYYECREVNDQCQGDSVNRA
ncbi:NAD(P)-dependent oxidoreductase [Asaia sp. BMEF1]|uniref:NAD-dependent epimerase/dehydratase family protein n=1 Tax=Asaia sp. BMEF1 TaxID=3155932 RepID=UPI003F675367